MEKKVEKNQKKEFQLSKIQKIIGKRLHSSYINNIHASIFTEVDMSNVFDAKNKLKIENPNFKYSINAFLIRAVTNSIKEFPIFNSHYIDEKVIINKDINIGFALDIDDRLIVPNIKKCNNLSLKELAIAVNEKIEAASNKKLSYLEMKDGTFTINNLGNFDVNYFTSIINPPEVAILNMGSVKQKPIYVKNKIDIKPLVIMGLTFNHSVINGMKVAKFLHKIKINLEELLFI